MIVQKALKEICLQDKEEVFLFSEYEPETKLLLKIVSVKSNKAYTGEASILELRAQAAGIRLTYSEFINKVISALFLKTPEDLTFLYSLDKKNEKHVFKWKSIDEEETIINLGSIEMIHRGPAVIFTEVLKSISEEICRFTTEVQLLTEELNDSKSQASEAMKQLSVSNNIKETLEKELYSKFVLVLNEKKRKISALQHDVNSNLITKPQKKIVKSKLISSDSDSSHDCKEPNMPGPSKTENRNSLLFLDDDKPAVPLSSTQSRRRNRKVPVTKKAESSNDFSTKKQISIETTNDDVGNDSDDLLKYL